MSTNPYAYAVAGRDPVEVITATPIRLSALLQTLTAEAIEAKPAPDKWSVREVICHLADCEIAFGFRLRQTYGGERTLQPFDQDAWARAYGAYTVAQALEIFRTSRAWNVAFVKGLSEADKALPAFHPERGEMTLWTIVETMAGHDVHHLAKLEQ